MSFHVYLISASIALALMLQLRNVSAATVKFRNTHCETYNKTKVEINYCRIEPLSRFKNTLSVFAQIKEQVNTVNLTLKFYKRANGWHPFMFDITVDACDFLRHRKRFPVVNWMWSNIAKFTNIDHGCPFNHDLWIAKFQLFNKTVKLPFAFGEYLVDGQFMCNSVMWARLNFSIGYSEF